MPVSRLSTAERWLSRYRRTGLAGLARPARSDADGHRLPADLVAFIEGMGLKKPRASVAAIHRRIGNIAEEHKWPVPSYSTVYAILADLDPAMVTLAHDGAAAFRNRYELIHRHRAETANAIWQADHTMLDPRSNRQDRPSMAHDRDGRSFPRSCGHHGVFRRSVDPQHQPLRFGRRSGGKAIRLGRFPVSPTCSTSITGAISRASTSIR